MQVYVYKHIIYVYVLYIYTYIHISTHILKEVKPLRQTTLPKSTVD